MPQITKGKQWLTYGVAVASIVGVSVASISGWISVGLDVNVGIGAAIGISLRRSSTVLSA
jgi:hypothetical protein